MSMGASRPPGWYPAQGDPPGTQRWWDGAQWVGGPVPVGGPQWGGFAPGGGLAGGRRLAGPWERIGARLIDGLLVGVVSAVIAAATDAGDVFGYKRAFIQTAVAGVYAVLMIGLRGATVGKMALDIAVVRQADGVTPPGIDVAARRWIIDIVGLFGVVGAVASLVIFIINLVYLFSDPNRLTINDRIARTYVVKR